MIADLQQYNSNLQLNGKEKQVLFIVNVDSAKLSDFFILVCLSKLNLAFLTFKISCFMLCILKLLSFLYS